MAIMRFDPFAEVDRLFEDLGRSGRRSVLALDVYRRGDNFVVHVDMPGIDTDSIELTTEKNVLTVTAERRYEPREEDEILIQERPQGRFSRQLFLGEGLDPEKIQASYDQGVLTVTIPMAEKAKPRRIQVGGGGSQQQPIETQSVEQGGGASG